MSIYHMPFYHIPVSEEFITTYSSNIVAVRLFATECICFSFALNPSLYTLRVNSFGRTLGKENIFLFKKLNVHGMQLEQEGSEWAELGSQ